MYLQAFFPRSIQCLSVVGGGDGEVKYIGLYKTYIRIYRVMYFFYVRGADDDDDADDISSTTTTANHPS